MMVIHKQISKDYFLERLTEISKHKVTENSIYLKQYGEAVNLSTLLQNKSLESILVDRAEFEITEVFEEGVITVHLSFNGKIKTIKADKNTTIQYLLDQTAENFNINMEEYYLKGKTRDFDMLDRKELLSSFCDDFVIDFEVYKFEKKIHEIQIIKISDNYDKTKQRESKFYKTEEIPTTASVTTYIENIFGKPENSLAVYKLNAFEEPIKRVKLKDTLLKSFETEGKIKIMVKDSLEMLNFELQQFTVFVPISYPYDSEKKIEIKIAVEDTIAELKEKVLAKLNELEIFTNTSVSDYYFQVLNTYNVPGKYLLNDTMLVKKHLFKTRKILVRPKDDSRIISSHDICIFVRTRNSFKRIYEDPREVLIPEKHRNINSKNYNAFKTYILEQIEVSNEYWENVELVFLDFKNYKWSFVKDQPINIKDGDDFGIVFNVRESNDDLQTDELLALKMSNTSYEKFKGHKEKAFQINIG